MIPILVGLAGIGFLMMFAATQVPALSYISCVLIGFSMISCQLLPLYGAVMMKSYPSKSISPIIISLALGAVLVQGSMVEIFRSAPTMLYLVYAIIMAVLVFVYMQIEPFLMFTLRRRIPDEEIIPDAEIPPENTSAADAGEAADKEPVPAASSIDPFAPLSKKEREVAELICLGYTNKDIASLLFISEHTVKDHTKKIYPKMGVHSRLALASIVNQLRANDK